MSRKYQRYDEKYEDPLRSPWLTHYDGTPTGRKPNVCSICKVNPPTRRWEHCCLGRGAACGAYDSPPSCSPGSNRMKTCGDCRAKQRAKRKSRQPNFEACVSTR
jgi:hypothetical protein